MESFSDELLNEIKSRNDIVDVISQYVVLKRKGRNYFGLCPFHNEKSPSFSVSPDKQIFKCFGCNVGGDVFRFIMKIENVNFVESVQILAKRVGIEVKTNLTEKDEKIARLKEKVYALNKEAAEFYHRKLYEPTSKQAQEYIKKRKLDNNTLKSFLIGYSGNNNELYNHLKEKGFDEETMLASSLIGKNENGRMYDKFRNRLMIPIQDIRNRVIAFGGRVLDDSKPKYINSPENIVYSKGRNLFGLNVAKRNVNGILKRILIVEGYMDAISLYQRGITNVVASLGTALTDNQGRLLRRNAEQVILGYDADGAGQNAIMRGISILQSMGIDLRILQIYDAKDPDEFIIKYGPDKFKKCMDDAISVVEFKVKIYKQNLDLTNINDKIKFLNLIAKTLSEIDNEIERELYTDKIANTYNISKEAIFAEVKKLTNKNTNKYNSNIVKPIELKSNNEEKVDEKTLRQEKMLIYLLANYPNESYKRISSVADVSLIKDKRNRQIISTIYEKYSENASSENLIDWFRDEDMADYISGILVEDYEINDVNKAINDLEKIYLREQKIAKRNELLKKLDNKEKLSQEELKEVENELNSVIIDLARMK